ncbi:hypothetical protein HSX11_09530 [Oxalobacteraceae bacterium]|nr:hypothetical protein [Oxalobacteraceae bacterium]
MKNASLAGALLYACVAIAAPVQASVPVYRVSDLGEWGGGAVLRTARPTASTTLARWWAAAPSIQSAFG